MNFSPHVVQALGVIQNWDWSSVAALKVAFDQISRSKNSIYSSYLDDLIRELSKQTEAQVILPVYPRRIIAVDLEGFALTGTIDDLKIERLPASPT
jgi:hypothetical protein